MGWGSGKGVGAEEDEVDRGDCGGISGCAINKNGEIGNRDPGSS